MESPNLCFVYVVALLVFRGSRIFRVQASFGHLGIGEHAIGYHVAHIVDEAAQLHAQPIVVVFGADVVVVALLGLQVFVADSDVLGLVVLVVHLQQGGRAVARAVSCTQTELAGAVHQGNAWRGIAAEVTVVDVADANDALQVLQESHLVLGKERERVHRAESEVVALVCLVDVFCSSRKLVPTAEAEDAFQRTIIIMCLLRKLCAAGSVGIERVALAYQVVAVEVCLEVCLAAELPCGSCTVHVVLVVKVIAVGILFGKDGYTLLRGAFEVASHLRTVGVVVVEASLEVEGHALAHVPCEALVELVAVEALAHHPTRWLQFAHHFLHVVHLPVVGLPVLEGGTATEASLLEIHSDGFRKPALAGIGCVVGDIDDSFLMLLCRGSRHRWSCRDDVDDAAYRLAAIEG